MITSNKIINNSCYLIANFYSDFLGYLKKVKMPLICALFKISFLKRINEVACFVEPDLIWDVFSEGREKFPYIFFSLHYFSACFFYEMKDMMVSTRILKQ